MSIEHIKLSNQAKDQLVKLKRFTGIKNWNVLCRWAFCVSLAEKSKPAPARIPADSSVEMTWRVFAGNESEVYRALLIARCQRDGFSLDEQTLAQQFRLHLHRGIGYLAANKSCKSIADFCEPLLSMDKQISKNAKTRSK